MIQPNAPNATLWSISRWLGFLWSLIDWFSYGSSAESDIQCNPLGRALIERLQGTCLPMDEKPSGRRGIISWMYRRATSKGRGMGPKIYIPVLWCNYQVCGRWAFAHQAQRGLFMREGALMGISGKHAWVATPYYGDNPLTIFHNNSCQNISVLYAGPHWVRTTELICMPLAAQESHRQSLYFSCNNCQIGFLNRNQTFSE